ncbi:MAG: hypothetical protein A3D82_04355 [Candidatus Levybacteria bacterium RIFCSPHIGHO2_02_FULL_40_29]|nr:MAG: hypothetical protein A3D82_04355 [Candidatus Levybacteria bacterium RIFCSPHIGHO2_02_FULL_40_29]
MFKKEYVSFLCCPDCRASLSIKDKQFTCSICKNEYPLIGSIPVLVSSSMAKDVKLSREKWDAEYKKTVDKDKARSLKKNFKNIYLSSTMSYIEKLFDSYKNKKYLEIGCGPFFIGQEIATKGAFVVGIDYSMNALKLAKFYLDEEGIDNYLLVCGDIAKMPFKDNVFDILYGGGVIEHFKDTVGVVKENHRVLKKGGVAFNSVPKLNLGSLTYRQMWGNIPSAPVLKQIAEFVHIKILKGKRMIYGYEYSFTDSQLRKIFAKAGFRRENIDVGRYEVPLLLEYIKNKSARKIAMAVAQSNLFWPATYILSKK